MNPDEADKPNLSGAATEVVALAEEEVSVDKRRVVAGRVRLRTITDVADELVREELQGTRAEIERVPVDRLLEVGENPPTLRVEGEVTIVPVVEEVLVVEKRLTRAGRPPPQPRRPLPRQRPLRLPRRRRRRLPAG